MCRGKRNYLLRVSIIVIGIVFNGNAPTVFGRDVKYKKVVPVGVQIERIADSCVSFRLSMTSGDFFDGLTRVDTKDGSEFVRQRKRIDSYPEHLSLDITVTATSCDGPFQVVPVSQAVRDKLSKLQITAHWTRGGIIRPAIANLGAMHDIPWTELADSWKYSLEIDPRGAFLSDHLVVELNSDQGERLSQFDFVL